MASPAGHRNVFRFGLFEADSGLGELRKQGEQVRLQDQPFRMLILLVEHAGKVVTREELREKLWPQNTFVEFDNGLNVAVKKIRDALGDSAENPRFVETIPRRGYRFIAPVSIKPGELAGLPAQAPDLAPARTPMVAADHPRRARYVIAAGLLIAIAATAVVVWRNLHQLATNAPAASSPAVASRRIVAVMEFQNVSRRSTDEWLSTGIAEMLTTELGAGEKLQLVPGEDISRMTRELHLPPSSSLGRETAVNVGRNLKADMLVLGSFTAMGNGRSRRVRVDVRMQDSTTGEIVAEVAETAPEEQLFELVARAGTRLREALGVPGVSPMEETAARAALPSNPEASRLYAEGLSRLRVFDAAGARDLLQQAVLAEPKFPLSHMALASGWRALGYDQKAKEEAKKALDLSSHLPRGDRLLIEARFHEISGEMDQAISAYRALFALFPDSLEDGLMLAEAQSWGGKPVDALATLGSLRRLPEPLSQDPRIDLREGGAMNMQGRDGGLVFIRRAEEKARKQGAPLMAAKAQVAECSTLLFTGHYEEAAQACEESHRVFAAAGNAADSAQTERFLGDIRMRQGRLADAMEKFQETLKINQGSQDVRGTAVTLNEMAIVYEAQGNLKQAAKLYHRGYLLFLQLGHPKNASILASNESGILMQVGKLAEAEIQIKPALRLGQECGSQDAQAAAVRIVAELARLRGRLDEALEQARTAQSLNTENDPVAKIDDFVRLGRILAARGDLAGARKNVLAALEVAEKTGAKGQVAQSHLELAQLDMEEGHMTEAEQSIRGGLAVFQAEKMHDDELQAQFALSRSLAGQGKAAEARAALESIRAAVMRSQNPATRFIFSIASAQAVAADRTAPASARNTAHAGLQQAIRDAGLIGYKQLEYEARLAQLELYHPVNGKAELSRLAADAHTHGFDLIALRARTIAQKPLAGR